MAAALDLAASALDLAAASIDEAAGLHAQTSWLLLPKDDARSLGQAVDQAHAWRTAARNTLGAVDTHYAEVPPGMLPSGAASVASLFPGSHAGDASGTLSELKALHSQLVDGRCTHRIKSVSHYRQSSMASQATHDELV